VVNSRAVVPISKGSFVGRVIDTHHINDGLGLPEVQVPPASDTHLTLLHVDRRVVIRAPFWLLRSGMQDGPSAITLRGTPGPMWGI
jgi:hypothetical protein